VIARRIERHVLPEPSFLRDIYHHDLDRLVGVADLRIELGTTRRTGPKFNANWAVVRKWSAECRYQVIDHGRSVAIVRAVGESPAGVFPWLQKYW
jgi:hypothetical protein